MNWLFNRLPENPTTITGRMVGIATVTALLAVVDSSLIPLLSQLIWVVIIAFVCGLLFRPKLDFHLRDSPLLVNGEVTSIEIVIENVGRYPAYDVQLSFPLSEHGLLMDKRPQVIGELAARGRTVLAFQVLATSRGEHPLPKILIASLFPLGMFKFISKQRIEASLVVAPNYSNVTYDENSNDSGDSSFGDLTTRRQRALEYIGSREYRDGMPVRRWDFAAWARLGVPSIREFNEAQEPAALIVVDGLKRRSRVDDELETLISKTAAASVALDRSGFRVVLIVVGADIEIVDGCGNRDQADILLRCLARIVGSSNQPLWSEVWNKVNATIEQDWDLLFYLRSDHSGDSKNPPSELVGLDPVIDWTPSRLVDLSSSSVRRKVAT